MTWVPWGSLGTRRSCRTCWSWRARFTLGYKNIIVSIFIKFYKHTVKAYQIEGIITVGPRSPGGPGIPGLPSGPGGPTAPGNPRTPSIPCGPRSPIGPGEPGCPVSPLGPGAPSEPRRPRGPLYPYTFNIRLTLALCNDLYYQLVLFISKLLTLGPVSPLSPGLPTSPCVKI